MNKPAETIASAEPAAFPVSVDVPLSQLRPVVDTIHVAAKFIFRNKLHIAVCCIAALWAWAKLLQVGLIVEDFLVLPLAVTCVYQWNRLTDTREDRINCYEDFSASQCRQSQIRLLCALSLLGLALLLVHVHAHRNPLIPLGTLGLGFLYSTGIPFLRSGYRLKNTIFLKNLAPSAGWAALTVLFAASGGRLVGAAPVWLAFAYMLAAVFMVEVVWDIRDLEGDRVAGIGTFPVRFGVNFAIRLIHCVNVGVALCVVSSVAAGWVSSTWLFTLANAVLIHVWLVHFASEIHRKRVLADVLVLGETTLLVGLGIVASLGQRFH